MDTTSPTSERNGKGNTDMLTKKSPMHKLARLAKLAGTTIGKDAINSKGLHTKCCNINKDYSRCILKNAFYDIPQICEILLLQVIHIPVGTVADYISLIEALYRVEMRIPRQFLQAQIM